MDIKKIKDQVLKDIFEEIPDLIKGASDFSLKSLKSKKNIVCELTFNKKPLKFPKVVVLKLFQTAYFEKEYNALIKLKEQNLPIPEILFYKKPYLILKKINGANLCDFINYKLIDVPSLESLDENSQEMLFRSVKKLAEWFAQLHAKNIANNKDITDIIVLNKGDAHLRDFIYEAKKNIVYGMDFEESYDGNYLDDLAWICCSFLDTNPGIFEIPEGTVKMEFINYFLKEYFAFNDKFKFSFNYFADRLIENLNAVIKRRPIELRSLRKNVILENILKKL